MTDQMEAGMTDANSAIDRASGVPGEGLRDAEWACRQEIALFPRAARLYDTLGHIIGREGRIDEALAAVRKAVELDPSNAQFLFHLGQLLAHQGELIEAERACRTAIGIEAGNAVHHDLLGHVLGRQGRIDEALIAVQRALDLTPNSPHLHFHQGQWLANKGEHGAAERAYQRAISLDPREATFHSELSRVLAVQKRPYEAVIAVRRAIGLAPDNTHLRQHLASLLEQIGEPEAAVAPAGHTAEPAPAVSEPSSRAVAEKPDLARASAVLPVEDIGAAAVVPEPQTASPGEERADPAAAEVKGWPGIVPGRRLFVPDPVLGWRINPCGSRVDSTLDRTIIEEADNNGYRPVAGQPDTGRHTFAAYGCSMTFGDHVMYDETFCSALQSMLPDWRVENHGISGYGTGHNLIQLERDSRFGGADFVTFCWIPDHLLRNVADYRIFQRYLHGVRGTFVETYPKAYLDDEGRLRIKNIAFKRPELAELDLSDFSPDWYYMSLLTFRIFERANEIVRQGGGHFFVTVLAGTMSANLRTLLANARIPVFDTPLDGPQYWNAPNERHPNPGAHHIYAERFRDYLAALTSQIDQQGKTPS